MGTEAHIKTAGEMTAMAEADVAGLLEELTAAGNIVRPSVNDDEWVVINPDSLNVITITDY